MYAQKGKYENSFIAPHITLHIYYKNIFCLNFQMPKHITKCILQQDLLPVLKLFIYIYIFGEYIYIDKTY